MQREEYPQVFTRIDLIHDVIGPGVTEAGVRRCIELSATKYCPVSAMLSMGETEIHHGYRIENTGADPFTALGEVVVTGPALGAGARDLSARATSRNRRQTLLHDYATLCIVMRPCSRSSSDPRPCRRRP